MHSRINGRYSGTASWSETRLKSKRRALWLSSATSSWWVSPSRCSNSQSMISSESPAHHIGFSSPVKLSSASQSSSASAAGSVIRGGSSQTLRSISSNYSTPWRPAAYAPTVGSWERQGAVIALSATTVSTATITTAPGSTTASARATLPNFTPSCSFRASISYQSPFAQSSVSTEDLLCARLFFPLCRL